MSRFKSRRAIAAYAGLNPKIRQSGDVDGIHLAIEKKGNRHLSNASKLSWLTNE
jgi:transposase